MPDVQPCRRCGNQGVVPITPHHGYTHELCPECSGTSNPALMRRIEEDRAQAYSRQARDRVKGQDRHRELRRARKRQRAARRRAR